MTKERCHAEVLEARAAGRRMFNGCMIVHQARCQCIVERPLRTWFEGLPMTHCIIC
jgi:hypothetical protein